MLVCLHRLAADSLSQCWEPLPLIFAPKHSASGGCNCQGWSHWEPFPAAAPGAKDTDVALPSSGVPSTSAKTCHYLRLPCHRWAPPFSRVFWEGTLVSFPGTCPTAAHLAFKSLWNVLWLFSLFNEPTRGTFNFASSRPFPRHSHLHRLCGDSQTLFCCWTNPSAESLITKSVGLPKEILHR